MFIFLIEIDFDFPNSINYQHAVAPGVRRPLEQAHLELVRPRQVATPSLRGEGVEGPRRGKDPAKF